MAAILIQNDFFAVSVFVTALYIALFNDPTVKFRNSCQHGLDRIREERVRLRKEAEEARQPRLQEQLRAVERQREADIRVADAERDAVEATARAGSGD
eukprot:SAG31_NODE_1829_length_7156_cov_3.390251_2_plen_98_part_00